MPFCFLKFSSIRINMKGNFNNEVINEKKHCQLENYSSTRENIKLISCIVPRWLKNVRACACVYEQLIWKVTLRRWRAGWSSWRHYVVSVNSRHSSSIIWTSWKSTRKKRGLCFITCFYAFSNQCLDRKYCTEVHRWWAHAWSSECIHRSCVDNKPVDVLLNVKQLKRQQIKTASGGNFPLCWFQLFPLLFWLRKTHPFLMRTFLSLFYRRELEALEGELHFLKLFWPRHGHRLCPVAT